MVGGGTAIGAAVPVDLELLRGFGFACRPACGLCCYAQPFVEPEERAELLQLAPSVELVSDGAATFVAAYPEGGSCRLLSGDRCRAHAARPSPCREFPLTAHVGTRIQATVVLGCPGVDMGGISGYHGPSGATGPRGLELEVAALRARAAGVSVERLETGRRRHRKLRRVLTQERRWADEEDVRSRLREKLPRPGPREFPAEGPPEAVEGLENLPLWFGGNPGPLAMALAVGGWEVMELRPGGGVARSLGVYPPPARPPALSEDGGAALEGYLRYWLERDVLFGSVQLAMLSDPRGTVEEWVARDLRRVGAITLSRARVLAALRGAPTDPLSAGDVVAGVRATDADLLDRPSWGQRL